MKHPIESRSRRRPQETRRTHPVHNADLHRFHVLLRHTEQLDKVFGQEIEGESYSRYSNPTNTALEELVTALENGAGALVCSSGMMARAGLR